MPTVYNLRASNNATFHWTRDFTALAAVYNLAAATIRMQARTSPQAPDPPAYQWVSGATSGGQIVFNPTTHLCVFTAPEADMAAMPNPLVYDCRLELPGGESLILFAGKLCFLPGVTRLAADATSETGVSGIGDTVSVDGEVSTSPTPVPLSLSAVLAASQAAISAALAPAALAAAVAAMIQSLPTAPSSSGPTLWSDGGAPVYS